VCEGAKRATSGALGVVLPEFAALTEEVGKMNTPLAGTVKSSELNESASQGTGQKAVLGARQKALVGLEGFISVCGLAGGVYMATHPITTMPVRYLQGTWFHTWRWPGLALFFFVGICSALVLVATIESRRIAIVGHILVGVGLFAWAALETAWIVVSPVLQLLVGAVGTTILALGLGEWAKSRRTPKAATGS
jgi:hypothetical protein